MAISQQWKDTVNKAIADKRWDEYDTLITKEVVDYNKRFANTPKFSSVNWLYIKAILWTESGGADSPSWKTRPMQIGNPGDPAYNVLKSGGEGSNKIMDATLISDLKTAKINEPKLNIRAGIAYLFTRMAKVEWKYVPDEKDTKTYEHQVAKGEALASIAQKKGTTIDELKVCNKLSNNLIKPGKILKYHKIIRELVIVEWRTFDPYTIAQRYNGGGDPNYSEKLTYLVNDVFPKLNRDGTKN